MKRIKSLSLAFIISIIISSCSLFCINKYMSNEFEKFKVPNNSIRYSDSFSKYKTHDAIVDNIDKDTILLMGSSELIVMNDVKEHPKQFLDYSDKHIMQIGEGYFQSIIQAITLGSIGENLPINEVTLILSIQWFDKKGMLPESFSSRFSIDHLNNLYNNKKISDSTKKLIYNRIKELSKDNKMVVNHIKRMERNNLLDKFLISLYNRKYKLLANYDFYKRISFNTDKNIKKMPSKIDWDKAMTEATNTSKEEANDNKFYINNKYYDYYFKDNVEKFRNSNKDNTFSKSPEYEDLKIFLEVAKDLGLKVNLVMVPLQGYWADYTGISHDEINKYYENIRNISREYNAKLFDYSKYSYKPYFFKDTSHLGRLGLLQLQKDLLNK